MNEPSISHITLPKGHSLEPPPSSHLILSLSYELRPSFIAKVREQPFSGEEDENLYTHLRDFEQWCSCVNIQGMRQGTLKWKLFPFSLMGIAKRWYLRNVDSVNGEWERLQSKFYLAFFPIPCVIRLQKEVINFSQKEKEPLGAAWARLLDLSSSGPDLAITEPTLLQHFYGGLSKESALVVQLFHYMWQNLES